MPSFAARCYVEEHGRYAGIMFPTIKTKTDGDLDLYYDVGYSPAGDRLFGGSYHSSGAVHVKFHLPDGTELRDRVPRRTPLAALDSFEPVIEASIDALVEWDAIVKPESARRKNIIFANLTMPWPRVITLEVGPPGTASIPMAEAAIERICRESTVGTCCHLRPEGWPVSLLAIVRDNPKAGHGISRLLKALEIGPVGRNAPCACGSGLKYKTCHGPVVDRRGPRRPPLAR